MNRTYQTRRNATAAWTTLAGPWSFGARPNITDAMELAGMRASELADLLDDLRAGHLLTAENGREFQAI